MLSEVIQLWRIATKEKMHFFWLFFVFVFGFIGIWLVLLSKDIYEAKTILDNNYDLYSVIIGILAPELFGLLLKIYFEKKKNGYTHFIKIKFKLVFLGVPFLLLLCMLESGYYKQKIWLQIIIAILVVCYTFMCYLASFLDPDWFKKVFKNYGQYSLQLYLLNGFFLTASRTVVCKYLGITDPIIIIASIFTISFFISYLFIKYFCGKFAIIRCVMGF